MRHQNRIKGSVGLSDHIAQLLFGQSGPPELLVVLHREFKSLKKDSGAAGFQRIHGIVMEHANSDLFHFFEKLIVISIQFLIILES